MLIYDWLSENWIEIFGAITGIIYVFLEIRQNIWLWPVGIITSAVYIIVFFSSKFYADMGLQGYYLLISCAGWYWWHKGTGRRAQGAEYKTEHEELPSLEGLGAGSSETKGLVVTRLKLKTGLILLVVFVMLYCVMWLVLSRVTDSPVPEWDSLITSLSIVATWMLARKIYEHWYLWVAVNSVASVIFFIRGLYPTVLLYIIYLIMSFVGLREWSRYLKDYNTEDL
jgi:nicotinamide mononucleotide transporter